MSSYREQVIELRDSLDRAEARDKGPLMLFGVGSLLLALYLVKKKKR